MGRALFMAGTASPGRERVRLANATVSRLVLVRGEFNDLFTHHRQGRSPKVNGSDGQERGTLWERVTERVKEMVPSDTSAAATEIPKITTARMKDKWRSIEKAYIVRAAHPGLARPRGSPRADFARRGITRVWICPGRRANRSGKGC